MRIEGVNISTVLNRQLNAIGQSSGAVKMTLRKLARGSGDKGKRISSSEAHEVCKKAGLKGLQQMLAAPYGEDGYQVFYYRTGSASYSDAWLAGHVNRFRDHNEDPHIWAILLGKFDGDKLVEPPHDNSPEEIESDSPALEPVG